MHTKASDGSPSADRTLEAATAPRSGWKSRGALAVAVLLAIVLFYALGGDRYVSWDYLHTHLDQLRDLVKEHLLPALALFFLAYVAATALSLPVATVLTLAAGALFDLWLGTTVVSLASTLGATLAFLGSRYLFRDFVQRRFGPRLESLDRGVERDGAFYLLTLRLVPAVPFWLVNLGMGLTRMRPRTFAVVSMIGMLPATLVYERRHCPGFPQLAPGRAVAGRPGVAGPARRAPADAALPGVARGQQGPGTVALPPPFDYRGRQSAPFFRPQLRRGRRRDGIESDWRRAVRKLLKPRRRTP
jgi:uncharacterized membrane protein YdjX (TVP38/TMEM64 family)